MKLKPTPPALGIGLAVFSNGVLAETEDGHQTEGELRGNSVANESAGA